MTQTEFREAMRDDAEHNLPFTAEAWKLRPSDMARTLRNLRGKLSDVSRAVHQEADD